MIAWLQNNMMAILTVWGVLWALSSCLQNVFPVGSWPYKVCHVVLALSPADFAKALKIVGTAMIPPTLALLLVVGVLVSACGGSQTAAAASAANVQAAAKQAVATASEAWNAAAGACLAAAGVTDAGASNPALAHECAVVLQPAHDAIVAAGVAANAWDSVAQNNYACLMAQVSDGLGLAIRLLPGMPAAAGDARIVAAQFGATCPDGGK